MLLYTLDYSFASELLGTACPEFLHVGCSFSSELRRFTFSYFYSLTWWAIPHIPELLPVITSAKDCLFVHPPFPPWYGGSERFHAIIFSIWRESRLFLNQCSNYSYGYWIHYECDHTQMYAFLSLVASWREAPSCGMGHSMQTLIFANLSHKNKCP